jgi:uncharacterized protein (DUF4415 family)
MPWAIMDQAVGLPALNGCFIDGIFFVANHLIMTKEKIVRYSSEELRDLETGGGDKTDWKRVRSMKDEDIIYDDDSPEITENMFDKAFISRRTKTEIRFLLDSDLIEWYKKQNIAYQPLVNELLRYCMEAHN